jgi:2-oxoacid:acceptor oxidoreductase delta subunit (pyruvate/2-ketoisovalerate family)
MADHPTQPKQSCSIRPFLRSSNVNDWPAAPQLESGHLASSNRGWRTNWPEISSALCTRCGLCFLYCPDGAVTKDAQGVPQIEADWCKGCGVCAAECPKSAIAMRDEPEE